MEGAACLLGRTKENHEGAEDGRKETQKQQNHVTKTKKPTKQAQEQTPQSNTKKKPMGALHPRCLIALSFLLAGLLSYVRVLVAVCLFVCFVFCHHKQTHHPAARAKVVLSLSQSHALVGDKRTMHVRVTSYSHKETTQTGGIGLWQASKKRKIIEGSKKWSIQGSNL